MSSPSGAVGLATCAAFVLALGVGAPSTARADPRDCGDVDVDRVDFPVTLSDGHDYRIAGFLYHRGSLRHRVLQLVVHGATYDHKYWDIDDLNGVEYSYARYMARQGYAVLAIDQMGTGSSSRPDGDSLTLDDTARALHQVIASLRTRSNPTGATFRDIALVGHSNGSLTSIYESGTYHDADALVSTAWLHAPHPLPFDPNFVLSQLTAPYIPAGTFPEPFIASTFYHLPTTDPAMVHYDYTQLQADQSRRQFLDLLGTSLNPSLSRSTGVTQPTLVQLGDFDALAPSSYGASEPSFYPGVTRLTVQQLTAIGHDVNAHRDHLQSWRGIDRWLSRTLGSSRRGD
jgi:pimeloyl-ACP methyl ester carboxylesterase